MKLTAEERRALRKHPFQDFILSVWLLTPTKKRAPRNKPTGKRKAPRKPSI